MRRNKSDDRKMNGLAFRQVRNFCKTRPLYKKADNPNARLIRAVALRSGRLRPCLSFCASVATLCTPRCHSEPLYGVKNLLDTSLTLSMTLSVILNEHSRHSEPLYGVKNLRGHDGGSLHKDYKGRVAQTAGVRCLQKGNARPFTKFN